ncbi:conjugal transfer protein TrbL family protein [Paenibacillus graminis]|uniref:Membrane protein n=1 Tax=Paenibacillus graminis TaxID=189425 RepID=A0A089NMH6_9BACL|nr:conjugal transfer protein TrbL family protein [Paenibacillus graminis]AIQ70254.1 membrane protein [Paenibacillus graminis]
MEKIILLLVIALLNGSLVYIDSLLKDIIPISLYAEKYMTLTTGANLLENLYDIVFSFGVALMILKFLKKGFEIYVLWTDGDPDEEPLFLLTNFFRSMAVAICFPTIYTWLGQIVEDLSNQLLGAIGQSTNYDWQMWVNALESAGLVTAVFGLIFVVCFFILYFQFLMRGLEMFILRVGIPLACVGLLDNDKGVFRAYAQKFMQSMLAVVIQIALAKLGVGLMLQNHVFWGMACMMLAIRTPRFLSDFLITTGGNGGVVNNVYHSIKLVGMARKLGKAG